jgi:GntR family transcriptional regulator/MocR family aminotransferase
MKEPVYLEPLFPNRGWGENLAVQLARRLRDTIERGMLRTGTRLLGSRQLAKRLGLGRNTVALAFEQLVAEGYLDARGGAGTFVAAVNARPSIRKVDAVRPAPARARKTTSLRAYFGAATGVGPLRPGMPDLSKFPASAWKQCARRALATYDRALGYHEASGLRALQEAIVTHLRQFRGVAAQPEQVIVLEGAQAALHLASLVLSSPGDRVVVEDPCYALARAAFELYGLKPHPVPVDFLGIDPGRLPHKVHLAFVTPTHQFPLGGTLPVARRLELLSWAESADAYILEDDYDSEFTAKPRPLPALQSLDRSERVLYIGSFSKTLAPAIRLGYLIVPPHLTSAFRVARASSSLGVSLQLQATVADFIDRGHLARHIRRMNAIYERRREILIAAMTPRLRRPFRLGPAQTGLHVALIGDRGFEDKRLALMPGGQRLVSLSKLCVKRRDCRGFLLGFANGSDSEIESAAIRLAELLVRTRARFKRTAMVR